MRGFESLLRRFQYQKHIENIIKIDFLIPFYTRKANMTDMETVIHEYNSNIDHISICIEDRLRNASRDTDQYWIVRYYRWTRTPSTTGYVAKGNLECAILKASEMLKTKYKDCKNGYIHHWLSEAGSDILDAEIYNTLQKDPSANIMELFSLERVIDFVYEQLIKDFSFEDSNLYFEKVEFI